MCVGGSPVMYRSALTPCSTDAPDPAHTATVLTEDSRETSAHTHLINTHTLLWCKKSDIDDVNVTVLPCVGSVQLMCLNGSSVVYRGTPAQILLRG